MLVLTRKTGQKLIIANDIHITVLETKGESVKLGIDAPRNIAVYREEIYEEITRANRQGTEQVPTSLDEAVNLIKPNIKAHPPGPDS
jgi:carbon storage regulator